jgi:hypothetical protein
MTQAYDIRLAILKNGFTPLPCSRETKRPAVESWPDIEVTQAHIDGWDMQFPSAQNHGVRLPAIDIDISDPEVCDGLENEIKDWFDGRGQILIRFGRSPRRLIPFRVDGDLKKASCTFKDAAGNSQTLELLGTRSQFIAYGKHPDGHAYEWIQDNGPLNTPATELPTISPDEAEKLFEHLCDVLVEKHGYAGIERAGSNGADNSDEIGDPFDADAVLAAMQPTGSSVEETQRRVILSRLQAGHHPDEILKEVVDATMRVADTAGLGWSRDVELDEVKRRISQQFETATRKWREVPPDWMPPEFYERAVEVLHSGRPLALGWNAAGPFIRKKGRTIDGHNPAPEIIDSGTTVAEETKVNGAAPPIGAIAAPAATALRRPRFPLIDFSTLVPTDDVPYLIEDLLPRRGLVVIWGKVKTLKSTWTLDAFLHVARGRPYRGLAVQQGRIVYCVFEGPHGYRNRIEALRRHYEIASDEVVPFHLMPASINLIKERRLLITEIKAQLTERGITDPPIGVVLDTLNRSLTGSESKDEDMGNYIKAADELREQFDSLVAIVHHCGHDETRPRGHSSLMGAIDGQIKVDRPERGTSMTAEVELMRDGPEGKVIRSIVKQIEVHTMPNGKVLTSPVLIPDEAAAKTARLPKEMKNARSTAFVRALDEAMNKYGVIYQPDSGMIPVTAVDQEKVRTRFYELYNDGKASPDTKKHAYSRALEDAQKARYIENRTDLKTGITMIWFCIRDDSQE